MPSQPKLGMLDAPLAPAFPTPPQQIMSPAPLSCLGQVPTLSKTQMEADPQSQSPGRLQGKHTSLCWLPVADR